MALPSAGHKAQPHRISGIISRRRLLEKLEAVWEHKLTLISAPPGYGKTTLVAQFARHPPFPVAWHTVEERERDVPNLSAHSIAVLKQIVPAVQNLPPTYGYESSELAVLLTEAMRTAGRFAYIIDDVQLLAGSPAAEAWLRTLVDKLPPTVNLILLSRILPDLPLAEMIARREVLAIGQHELRFTSEEIKQLPGASLYGTDADALADRLEGWPAGIVLALHPLPSDLERAMLSGGEGPEALFDALADLMLQSQPPDLRDFLLASSTLPRMTPELCSAALRIPNSGEWLAEAQTRGLFLTRTSGGLVYHRLFRSFLQRRLKDSSPDLFGYLHSRAGQWFEEQNLIDEAIDHFLEARATGRAAALAEKVAQSYFALGKVETLLNWGVRLGRAGASVPRLYHTCAMIHTDRYEYGSALAELEDAEAQFAARDDQIGLVEVHLQSALIKLQRGEYRDAVDVASELVPRLSPNNPGLDRLRARAMSTMGMALLFLGEITEAATHLEEALPLYRADGNAYALSQILQDMEIAYNRLGRFDEAVACLQEVVALRRSLGGSAALALALNNLGYHYHLQGDYAQALAIFQEGLTVADRASNRRAESYLRWSLGDLQRDRSAFEDAQKNYNRALESNGGSEPHLRCAILISLSKLLRWQGEIEGAKAKAEEAVALAQAHDIAHERALAQAALWIARAQLGQFEDAAHGLARLAEHFGTHNSLIELTQVLGLQAHVALLSGDTAIASQILMQAVGVGQNRRSIQTLIAEIGHAPALEALVTEHPARFEPLMRGLKQLRDAQPKEQVSASVGRGESGKYTYTLRIWTLGQESIVRDVEHIPVAEWTTAREVFLYLLFNGRQSRERISLVFWPENSTRRVRSNFHTTLYRIRQALGENVITFQDGLYLVNPDLDLWCDATQFEQLTVQARLLSSGDAHTEDMLRRAVELYRGEFLPSLDAEWVVPRRESLQEAYIEALISLGKCKRARHDNKGALEALRQALEVDPYREDAHRCIMECYFDLGEKKRIVDHLQGLRIRLRKDLAIEPSEETLTHAARLMN